MEELGQIVGLLFFSGIKFFLAPPAAVIAGYGLITASLICFAGGTGGFFTFYYLGNFFQRTYQRLIKKRSDKKTFTKKNKLIIKAKLSFGLIGLALLTPCLLGIPLGAILASNYYSKNRNAIPIFLTSILIWSIGLSYFSLYIKLP